MRTEEVNIRDPYVMVYQGRYYLYGTRSATCWEEADGFDCYISSDLKEWEGPYEIFHRPEGFFADRNYWAPECYESGGEFYLVTTFGSREGKKGIYLLKAKRPEGPFTLFSGRLTPKNWSCIDGTLYLEKDKAYLIFSHSFEDSPEGDMCMLELSADFKEAVKEPVKLFSAAEAEWAKPVPFAKTEFGMDGDVYFTDGPCLMKMNGSLFMTWSSWGRNGYAVGLAISESGEAKGPWIQQKEPVFPENGGHGMLFLDLEGKLRFTLHSPNDKYKERPVFLEAMANDGTLRLLDA